MHICEYNTFEHFLDSFDFLSTLIKYLIITQYFILKKKKIHYISKLAELFLFCKSL